MNKNQFDTCSMKKAGKDCAADLAAIYNSANLLFPEAERADAGPEAFESLLLQNETYVMYDENGQALTFMCSHAYGECYELTALYVRSDVQKAGFGERLLQIFEEQAPKNTLMFMKVLKNAPWALQFYKKQGYHLATIEEMEVIQNDGIKVHPWEEFFTKIK